MADAVNLLLLVFLGFCGVVLTAAAYWQVVRGPVLRSDARNPRLRLSAALPRGGILSGDGEVLVRSVRGKDGTYRREYLGTPGLAATIGYVSPRYGLSGLEAAYDAHLRGASWESWLAWLAASRWTRARGPLPALQLTIRDAVQRRAEAAMAGRRGALVALDPVSGEILALVSLPGFRPDRIDDEFPALRDHPESPLLNRTVAGLYPPGSAFKPVVALAGLEAGRAARQEAFVCTGRRVVRGHAIRDAGGAVHGRLDLEEAMAVSCNYVFSGLGMRLKPEELAEAADRFGVLAPAKVGLPAEVGRFPDPRRLAREDLAELGLGQGALVVTPFALARFTAFLANGGAPVEPKLVRSLGLPGSRAVRLGRTRGRQRGAVDAEAAAAVSRMLVQTVARGTGQQARIQGVEVAGKTGSAENPHGPPHAWFIGFAPARDPEVAVAVILENGGLGGQVAAPVAREVMAAALGR